MLSWVLFGRGRLVHLSSVVLVAGVIGCGSSARRSGSDGGHDDGGEPFDAGGDLADAGSDAGEPGSGGVFFEFLEHPGDEGVGFPFDVCQPHGAQRAGCPTGFHCAAPPRWTGPSWYGHRYPRCELPSEAPRFPGLSTRRVQVDLQPFAQDDPVEVRLRFEVGGAPMASVGGAPGQILSITLQHEGGGARRRFPLGRGEDTWVLSLDRGTYLAEVVLHAQLGISSPGPRPGRLVVDGPGEAVVEIDAVPVTLSAKATGTDPAARLDGHFIELRGSRGTVQTLAISETPTPLFVEPGVYEARALSRYVSGTVGLPPFELEVPPAAEVARHLEIPVQQTSGIVTVDGVPVPLDAPRHARFALASGHTTVSPIGGIAPGEYATLTEPGGQATIIVELPRAHQIGVYEPGRELDLDLVTRLVTVVVDTGGAPTEGLVVRFDPPAWNGDVPRHARLFADLDEAGRGEVRLIEGARYDVVVGYASDWAAPPAIRGLRVGPDTERLDLTLDRRRVEADLDFGDGGDGVPEALRGDLDVLVQSPDGALVTPLAPVPGDGVDRAGWVAPGRHSVWLSGTRIHRFGELDAAVGIAEVAELVVPGDPGEVTRATVPVRVVRLEVALTIDGRLPMPADLEDAGEPYVSAGGGFEGSLGLVPDPGSDAVVFHALPWVYDVDLWCPPGCDRTGGPFADAPRFQPLLQGIDLR